ncbi:LysR family transcriptional regulator [Novosphingobium profundi]|nr:LysR family transcriptional regulator [Novosphingobium profundi]
MMDVAMRYFYEAANQGSMRLASEKLGVAVSSISRQIGQLEGYLGVNLVEKGRRSVKLTEAGHLTYDFHRRHVAELDTLRSKIQDLRGVRKGSIRLAVGEGFLSSAFFQAIDGFHKKNPGLHIETLVGSTSEIVRMVEDDDVHMGLVLQIQPEPKVRVRLSLAQALMVLVHPSHPLTRKSEVTLADLAQHELCLPPKGFRIRQILADMEAETGTFLEPAQTTSSIVMMRDLASEGRFVTVLPQIAALGEIAARRLVAIPFADTEAEPLSVHLITRLGRQLEGAPGRMLSVLEAKMRCWASPFEASARNMITAQVQ